MILFFILLLLLDITFYATQPWRSVAAMGFSGFNTILKVPILFLLHVFLHELGGSYSFDLPITADGGHVGTGMAAPFQPAPAVVGGATKDGEASSEASVNFGSYQGV